MKNKKTISLILLFSIFISIFSVSISAYAPLELRDESNLLSGTLNGTPVVVGVSDNVTVDTLLTHFYSSDNITVTKDNKKITGSSYVGTGTILSYGSQSKTIIVKGDVSGDGIISTTDYLLIKKYILRKITLSDIYIYAADADESKVIDSTDYLQIRLYLLNSFELYSTRTTALEISEQSSVETSFEQETSDESTTSSDANTSENDSSSDTTVDKTYTLNISSKKIHLSTCSNAATISASNKQTYSGSLDYLLSQGYTKCGTCLGSDSSGNSSAGSSSGIENVPEYSGSAYCIINNNIPTFSSSELTTKGYEKYSNLDSLGRCGVAIASVGKETMPTGSRGDIGSIKPTGWVQATYSCISTGSLYNRSHLIAWSLCGEDANAKNLITGTAYMNQGTMTQFEDMVRDYINETGNHVAYRVTPIFKGNNLLCSGVQIEAYSVEDNGKGICFNVYCYNVQPGVTIDYATGKSTQNGNSSGDSSSSTPITSKYVINTSSKRIHLSSCSSVATISSSNLQQFDGDINTLLSQGYKVCAACIGSDTDSSEQPSEPVVPSVTYVLNTSSKKVHLSTCSSVNTISANNRKDYTGSIDTLLSQGYKVCAACLGSDTDSSEQPSEPVVPSVTYVLNTSSKKVHLSTCSSVNTISANNRKDYTGSIDTLLSQGYKVCAACLGSDTDSSEQPSEPVVPSVTYVLNTSSKKVHLSTCSSVNTISANNRKDYTGSIDTLLSQGYKVCAACLGSDTDSSEQPSEPVVPSVTYVLNTSSKKVHLSTCSSVNTISANNRKDYTGSIDTLLSQGYKVCAACLGSDTDSSEQPSEPVVPSVTYVLNTSSKKVHLSTCGSVNTISAKNKKEYTGSLDSLVSQGYTLCGSCKPQ